MIWSTMSEEGQPSRSLLKVTATLLTSMPKRASTFQVLATQRYSPSSDWMLTGGRHDAKQGMER